MDIAWSTLDTAVQFLLDAGVPVSAKPTGIRPPAQCHTWIGWVFDTSLGIVTVSQGKCDKCRDLCAQVLDLDNRRQLRAHFLASAAGLASHITEVFPQARRRLHVVWADLNAAGVYTMWAGNPRADPLVPLSELSRFNIAWLIQSLEKAACACSTLPWWCIIFMGGSLSRVC